MVSLMAATGILLPIVITAVIVCIAVVVPVQALCMKVFPSVEEAGGVTEADEETLAEML